MDALRPHGLEGPLHLVAHARDLVTHPDEHPEVAGESSLYAEVAYLDGRVLTRIESTPDEPRVRRLVGATTASRFRSRIADAVPDHVAEATRLNLMLDDVPVVTLVSGLTLASAGVRNTMARSAYVPVADVCSGWRTGGTMMREIGRTGTVQIVKGPPSPDLHDDADPIGWHPLPDLPPHSSRRARRLDLVVNGDELLLDSHFRDSHVDGQGNEEVIHEYHVSMWIDRATWKVAEVGVVANVQPWIECIPVTRSSDRIVGMDVRDLRSQVRAELRGIGTCTHLNDQYRCFADVPALLRLLPARAISA